MIDLRFEVNAVAEDHNWHCSRDLTFERNLLSRLIYDPHNPKVWKRMAGETQILISQQFELSKSPKCERIKYIQLVLHKWEERV